MMNYQMIHLPSMSNHTSNDARSGKLLLYGHLGSIRWKPRTRYSVLVLRLCLWDLKTTPIDTAQDSRMSLDRLVYKV